ncbi:hypothetical protein [Nonomuraea phyllanthi]|uniref:hypothetical protein n=1 Tax=Nonomuraea phyllanthi TaxID=2219224 RepID=UPI0012930E54|nr:hypothetical protein [Nonomuraea phyllanthi]
MDEVKKEVAKLDQAARTAVRVAIRVPPGRDSLVFISMPPIGQLVVREAENRDKTG